MLTLLLLLGGCAATGPQGQQGSLILSDEIRNLFESATILPDHVYYYTGPEAEPEAIIGIHADFTFQGHYWYQIAPSQAQLQSWNRQIDNAHRIRNAYKGARIMSPDGRQVGIWYSLFDHTVIRFPDEKTILIYTPGPPPIRGFLDGVEGRDFSGQGQRN
ncbi:MAG TPA: hypothetical protein DDY20_12725 [Desulfobulbaceae bacterium]|nr:hypothetical protein [Desulfobulbaceae bacterium]